MCDSLKTPGGRLREVGARYILAERAKGRTYRDIANELDVSQGTVRNTCKGYTWTWLKDA